MIADSPWESQPYCKMVIIINLCIKQNMLGPLGKMTTNNAKVISQSYIAKGDHGKVECTSVCIHSSREGFLLLSAFIFIYDKIHKIYRQIYLTF